MGTDPTAHLAETGNIGISARTGTQETASSLGCGQKPASWGRQLQDGTGYLLSGFNEKSSASRLRSSCKESYLRGWLAGGYHSRSAVF